MDITGLCIFRIEFCVMSDNLDNKGDNFFLLSHFPCCALVHSQRVSCYLWGTCLYILRFVWWVIPWTILITNFPPFPLAILWTGTLSDCKLPLKECVYTYSGLNLCDEWFLGRFTITIFLPFPLPYCELVHSQRVCYLWIDMFTWIEFCVIRNTLVNYNHNFSSFPLCELVPYLTLRR